MSRILGFLFWATVATAGALLFPACSGSGGGTSAGSNSAASFRLASCSLGCGSGTCAANTMAVNQDIVFTFNDVVDPATVSFTTVPVVELATGSTPPGSFLVSGRQVIFRPSLLLSDTGIRFGFDEAAVYEVRLFGTPDSNVVRSSIGRPNTTPIRCVITTSGIIDLVPGRPTVSFTPNQSNPPANRDFVIRMVFNDLMQVGQLVDPLTADSTTINVVIVDQTLGTETEVAGIYEASLNRDALTTTVTFTASTPYPGGNGGQRFARLDFAPQIGDLVGNTLANAGSYPIPLPPAPVTPGQFLESFDDLSMLDPAASTAGLWATPPGALDSGLDPVSGRHKGGGSGVLGHFAPVDDFIFNTDSMTIEASEFDTLSGEDVTVTKGVFLFDSVHIPAGVNVKAVGAWPLRLYSRGEFVVEGSLDLGGEDAPENFGKYFPIDAENIDGESQASLSALEAVGGPSGLGGPGGGAGGVGGASWYLFTEGSKDYYNEAKNNFQSPTPDPTRFAHKLDPIDNSVPVRAYGLNGRGVGNRNSTGDPWTGAANIVTDRRNGAGMGSWSWPLRSDSVPYPSFTSDVRILSHFDTVAGAYLNHALHRARGGGGGGFWADGAQGTVFDPAGTDPLGSPLVEPTIDESRQVFEYNSLLNWDVRASGTIPDGAGGEFDPALKPGIETLEPSTTAATNLLVGGAGGGGAGSSQHGSWNAAPGATRGTIDTYRTCDGGGGGGGGGALQVHSGARTAVSGRIAAAGGDGGSSSFMLSVPYSPVNAITLGPPGDAGGGGGAGGAILFEINSSLAEFAPDSVDVSGGSGGIGSAGNHGGAGGGGIVRFETLAGDETLAALQALVVPDSAVDLEPVGQAGMPNLVAHAAFIQDGDLAITGGTINGNSSGVRTLWFVAPDELLQMFLLGWKLSCEFDTGSGPQVEEFSHTAAPVPGTSPIWLAFQTGYGPPGTFEPSIAYSWVIPNGASGGLPELQSQQWRMIRVLIGFDQDQIQAKIGATPGAYYRVSALQIDWEGD